MKFSEGSSRSTLGLAIFMVIAAVLAVVAIITVYGSILTGLNDPNAGQ